MRAVSAREPRTKQHAREQAPGRVNLMGEHTDYNEGLVLPMPIPQQTTVETWPRDDLTVQLRTSESEYPAGHYELGHERPNGGWIDYVQGVTEALSARGHVLSGFDAKVTSTVPIGAGLASSAALEVALMRALRKSFDLQIEDLEIAKVGQAAEVDFVGVPVGIMDQVASSLGRIGSALLIDTRSLDLRTVKLPEGIEVIVIASGVVHAHGTGDYRKRREECERAALALRVKSLRDVVLDDLAGLSDPVLLRRARHVITEDARVLRTVEAFAQDDREQMRELFAQSHLSMRDDYEVSIPPIDTLVKIGTSHPSVIAARLTGGGFGGSVVMLAQRGAAHQAAAQIAERYAIETGLQPSILLPN